VTAPFSPIVLNETAPLTAQEGPEASAEPHRAGHEDHLAFLHALGSALAPGNEGAGACATARASSGADPSAVHAGLVAGLLHLEEQPVNRGASLLDEARGGQEPARRLRPHKRGSRAEAEAAGDADATAGGALAAALQNARHARHVPVSGTPAPAASPRRCDPDGESARRISPEVHAAARRTLHGKDAVAPPSALRSALAAADPLGLTAATAREQLGVHAPDRKIAEREKSDGKEHDAAKREAVATASRPEAPNAPALDPRAVGPRPAPATSLTSAPPSSPDHPRASLPPSRGPDVQGAVLRNAAHLKIEAGAMGALELHLRVREGALHLRVEGDAAGTVEARAGELSRALAGDGLKLAPIETAPRHAASQEAGTQQGAGGGRSFDERREAWNEAAESAQRAPPPQARPASPRSGNVYVKA
jgi:hypothetical protein